MNDLEKNLAITSVQRVENIARPLLEGFDIKHFRFLRLYQDKSRILLSNFADCTRFTYQDNTYQHMWYDGEFPEHLSQGWHLWAANTPDEKSPFEIEINKTLGLYHGMTLVMPTQHYWEIYTFDSAKLDLYKIDKNLLMRFIQYFKEQAAGLIKQGESEPLLVSAIQPIERYQHPDKEKISSFLESTRINRYYLEGKYRDVYLTAKEAQCIYWLIQGKSAQEIAIIENNSVKTIQNHLETVRHKLNCFKQSQIVKIILDSGLLGTLSSQESPNNNILK